MKQRMIIIGGMGPQASLELHRRIIRQALAKGAKAGTDFPHIVHLSLPVPDFIANESRHSEALEIIINELKNIGASMDDVIIIACNTAHLLQPDIEQRLNIRITSMVDAAICDGDWVVVREQHTADNGDIVAALLDDEATVKVFRQVDGHTWLMPRNSNYEPIMGDRATVMGKVVSVLRSL